MGSTTAPGRVSHTILLVHLPGPRNDAWIAAAKARYPGLEVRWHELGFDFAHPRPVAPDSEWEGVTAAMLMVPPGEQGRRLRSLEFLQVPSAGADLWTGTEVWREERVTICTANGAHAPQIAEWAIGAYLMQSHHFLRYAAEQASGTFDRSLRHVPDGPGRRVGILGYGAIGRQVARICSALGMQVYAYTRTAKTTEEARRDDSFVVAGTGDPDGLLPSRWFHGADHNAVNDFLAQGLDLVVLSLPLTEATRGLLGKEQFAILGRQVEGSKAFLCNVARGGLVDQEALLEALESGKIRGAALDVTDPEPLPKGHPLLTAPNCFVTPHISWQSPAIFERLMGVLDVNLERWNRGEQLINVVSRKHNY